LYRLCLRENKDSKIFNFKLEKKLKLKEVKHFQWKLGTSLTVICWEDLRKNPIKEKENSNEVRGAQKLKRRDSQTLTIMD